MNFDQLNFFHSKFIIGHSLFVTHSRHTTGEQNHVNKNIYISKKKANIHNVYIELLQTNTTVDLQQNHINGCCLFVFPVLQHRF